MRRNTKIVTALLLLLVLATLGIQRCTPKTKQKNTAVAATNRYVGENACKSCHQAEYKDWLSSDHFKAMQEANDSTVEGNFNDIIFKADGVSSRFFKKQGKYYINTQGPDGKNHDYQIKYTFGYYPLQQYLVAFPGGKLQVTRQSWDVGKKRWFDQYHGQKIPAHDWLHWTGNAQNWNTMCAACHNTDVQKNYDAGTDSYHTTFSVMTVSCESCHGPGQRHIQFVNSSQYQSGQRVKGAFLKLGNNTSQTMLINACAPCHSRSEQISQQKITSGELLDNYIPQIPTTEFYFADGQAKDEDYVYTSFLESKMYSRGVECSNCHNPHSGRVRYTTNALCLQCHAKKYDDFSHTFHQMGTVGSACKSCHMPSRVYMGIDVRYDHTFRVPRPDLSVKYGTPNACNNCHKDKTAQWAAAAVVKWYGPTRAYHFSQDLIAGSQGKAGSEGHLFRLLNDTATPAIIKATALYYLKDINTQESLQMLLNNLGNAHAQVRYQALESLSDFPAETWLSHIGPLLSDKVRAVRIAAADLLTALPSKEIPASYYAAFDKAKNELQENILFQSDFATGDAMAGDYFLKIQDYARAKQFYLLGLKKDTAMNYARLNLSVVYNLLGQNDSALHALQNALLTDPKNDRIYFNMALLYNEMKAPQKAKEAFAKAVALQSPNPRVYYNYGLLLEQEGDIPKAATIFKRGIQVSPLDADLNYALCLLYAKSNDLDNARKYGAVLKRYYEGNPQYGPLLQQLGL